MNFNPSLPKRLWHRLLSHFLRLHKDYVWKRIVGHTINRKNPRDFSEFITCRNFNADTSRWHLFADKILVRDYVKSKGLQNILIPLLGTWNNTNDIDFSVLPDRFVLKTNNGSGNNIIVDNRNRHDFKSQSDIRKRMAKALKYRYGLYTAEPHYLKIPPAILAEEFLQPAYSEPFYDYKFNCIAGKVIACLIVKHLPDQSKQITFLDTAGNRRDDWVSTNAEHPLIEEEIQCPPQYAEMIAAAEKLAEGLDFVRIDLYLCNAQIRFGEITLTPHGNILLNYSPTLQFHLLRNCPASWLEDTSNR